MPPAPDLTLPERTRKPRETGISNLVDNGYGLGALTDVLSMAADSVDVVKLGWASMMVTPNLAEKIELFRGHDIRTCPGGMMFELSYWQDRTEQFADWLRELGIDLVEISNGSLPIPEDDKRRMIERFSADGFTVLSEVGSKDVNARAPAERWVECIRADLEAGAWKVITEGRADASAGIYEPDGTFHPGLVETILDSGVDAADLVFEAPRKPQMTWFIQTVGPNVNIGNVPLEQVMNLETLRLGLRGDTVRHFHLDR